MTITKEDIDREVAWFNQQLERVQAEFTRLLRELGHTVKLEATSVTNQEEPSGSYQTTRYYILVDDDLELTLLPYGIWLIGIHGRIDIKGPSGTEKLIYLEPGNSGLRVDDHSRVQTVRSRTLHTFQNVQEQGWYWYDDSSYRRVAKLDGEVVEAILERVQ